jgi:hypothetical protein
MLLILSLYEVTKNTYMATRETAPHSSVPLHEAKKFAYETYFAMDL